MGVGDQLKMLGHRQVGEEVDVIEHGRDRRPGLRIGLVDRVPERVHHRIVEERLVEVVTGEFLVGVFPRPNPLIELWVIDAMCGVPCVPCVAPRLFFVAGSSRPMA